MIPPARKLTQEELATYEWQTWVPGFGESGQERLKGASVMISRVGGVGGAVALELAAAGVGKLILAHGGRVKPSDLNRQLLVTHASIGHVRIETIRQRLLEFNPRLELTIIDENVHDGNAEQLVSQADLVVDCAPLFQERFAMNQAAVRLGRPLIECAMYELEATLTTILPHQTPCLRCLFPEPPTTWRRQFPVFGAVAGTVGCLGAMEAIKLLAGLGQPLAGKLLRMDLRDMSFRTFQIKRRSNCEVCSTIPA